MGTDTVIYVSGLGCASVLVKWKPEISSQIENPCLRFFFRKKVAVTILWTLGCELSFLHEKEIHCSALKIDMYL